jgi:hypothetical protein
MCKLGGVKGIKLLDNRYSLCSQIFLAGLGSCMRYAAIARFTAINLEAS